MLVLNVGNDHPWAVILDERCPAIGAESGGGRIGTDLARQRTFMDRDQGVNQGRNSSWVVDSRESRCGPIDHRVT